MQSNDPVALTVHEVPTPADFKRRGRMTMFLVLLACVAPVIVSYFLYFVVRPEARSNYATLIQPTLSLPADLGLTTLEGQPISGASLKGQWLLMVVAGGACDAQCEALLFEQRQLREMTGREKDRIDRVWLVPDDEPVREPMLKAMQSGTPGLVARVPRAKLEAWLRPEAGQVLEDHLYLVDPMGEWMMRTPVKPEPQRFRKDLDRLLKASAFWDRAGRGN
ncbi:hypothetical protein [Ideonella sp.]|uniref:hypothetical protein n=1 Tax=Ideonella sp. TaxID=1929293 RepID=UPI003BB4E5E3